MARATVITVDAVGLNTFVMVHWPEQSKLMMTAIISNMGVVACVKKYLVEASMARGLVFYYNGDNGQYVYFKPNSGQQSVGAGYYNHSP